MLAASSVAGIRFGAVGLSWHEFSHAYFDYSGTTDDVIVRQLRGPAVLVAIEVGAALAEIPEVLEVFGVSGGTDLMILVAARNADDLYRVAGMILATPAVERTETSLIMRKLVDYRVQPLLERLAGRKGSVSPGE